MNLPDPVRVIVDHWEATHPAELDPSWPTVAKYTVAALNAAGLSLVRLGAKHCDKPDCHLYRVDLLDAQGEASS